MENTRTSLVTGGTGGIGRAVALRLAQGGDRVLIAGRNATAGADVVALLRQAAPGLDHDYLPADLSLTLYRNGPALQKMGGYRYRHWFDGDGMIRAWTVGQRGASVRTRMIRTAKLTAESAAGRRLLPAFG